jgi:RHS repeat-associated protein
MKPVSGVAPEIMTALPRPDATAAELGLAPLRAQLAQGVFGYALPLEAALDRGGRKLDLALAYDVRRHANGVLGVGWDLPQLRIERRTDLGVRYDASDRFATSDGIHLERVSTSEYRAQTERDFRRIRFIDPYWEITETDGTRLVFGDSAESRLADPVHPEHVAAWFLTSRTDTNGNLTRYRYRRDTTVKRPEGYQAAQVYLDQIEYVVMPSGEHLCAVRLDYDHARPDAWTSYRTGFPVRTNWRCRQLVAIAGNIDDPVPRVLDFDGTPFDVTTHDSTPADTYVTAGCYVSASSAERRMTVQWPVPPAEVQLAMVVPVAGARFRITQTHADDSTTTREEDAAPGHVIELDAGLRQADILALSGPLAVRTLTVAAGRVPEVVSRYRFGYHPVLDGSAVDLASIRPSVSLLSSVERAGYDDALQEETLPPLSFEYQPLSLAGLFPRTLNGTPPEALGQHTTPLAFFGTGRPDIMQTEGGHRVFLNRGQLGTDIVLERRELVASPSAQLGDRDVLLRDIDGRGAVDLTTTEYFYRNPSKLGTVSRTAPAWPPAVDFDPTRRHPQLSTTELPRSRSIDLDGDGFIDLLTTSGDLLEWTNLGDGGWSAARRVSRISSFGDKLFPDVSFDDASIFIADMNSDGQDEIVRVSARKVEYWARSRGAWAFKTTMASAPRWPDFDPDRVVVADLNGNGMADVMYLTGNGLALALNCGGDRFSPVIRLDFSDEGLSRGMPMPASERGTLVVDLLGDGTRGLLWSLPRVDVEPNYFFMPLCAGGKPGLLSAINNGSGGRVELRYTTSSRQAAEDELGGHTWHDEPPYPVIVVDEVREIDQITGDELVRRFRYRDGYYDRDDRDFRAFGQVVETVLDSPARKGSRIIHEYATGKPVSSSPEDRARARALGGAELRTSVHDLRTGALLRRTIRQMDVRLVRDWTVAVGAVAGPLMTMAGENIAFAYETMRLESVYEGASTPRHALWEESRLVPGPTGPVLDDFGRVMAETIHGEVVPAGAAAAVATFDIDGVSVALQPADLSRRRRVVHEYAEEQGSHLARHRCRDTTWGGATFTQLLMETRWYYDGGADADDHLPLTQVTQGNIQREENLVAWPSDLQAVVGASPVGYLQGGQPPAYLWLQQAADGADGWFSVDRRRIYAQANGRIRYGSVLVDVGSRGPITIRQFDDAFWYVRQEQNALGQQSLHRAICYRAGRPREIEQPDGTITTTQFDGLGRAIAVTEDSANIAVPQTVTTRDSYAFVTAGSPTSEITSQLVDRLETPQRHVDEIRYLDGWGRVIQVRRTSGSHGGDLVVVDRGYEAGGKDATFESVPYPSSGRQYQVANPVGVTRRRDALFRVFEIDFPGPVQARLEYGPWSVELHDPEDMGTGIAAGTPTRFDLDFDQRVVGVSTLVRAATAPATASTARSGYTYDAIGRLVSVTDPNGTLTTLHYDCRGDVTRVRHADAGDTVRLYDSDRRRIYERDATGAARWFTFDDLGRQISEVHGGDPGLAPTVVYAYDAGGATGIGRLTSAHDLESDVLSEYTYDGRGDVSRIVRTLAGAVADDVTVIHNDLRAPRLRTFAGGVQLEYGYGVDGFAEAVTLVQADGTRLPLITGIRYHASDRVAQADLCGGTAVYSAAFDSQTQRLRQRSYLSAASGVLYQIDVDRYDLVGNVLGYREQAPAADEVTWTLGYDSLYRLTSADAVRPRAPVATFSYQYDMAGNITLNDEAAPGLPVTYDGVRPDVLDRIGGGTPYVHDAAGRLTAGPDHPQIDWSGRALVDTIVATRSLQVDVSYDHDRQLVGMTRTTAAGVEELLFLGPEHERHAGVDYHLAMLDGLPCVAARADGSAVVLARGMAGVTRLIDDTGTVVPGTTELYGPFGSAIEAAADPWPRGYANAVRATPSIYLMGVRPYLAGLGRFGAVDPVLVNRIDRELLHEPRRLNPYLYALGNPHGYTDPSGLLAIVDDVVFYGIGSLLGLRNDSFFEGIWQNFVESWSVVLHTLFPFHSGAAPASIPGYLQQRSWGIINEAVGTIAAYGAVELFGGTTVITEQVQMVKVRSEGVPWGAFAIGDKVVGDPRSLSDPLPSGIIGWRHEQGHYYQNLLLGPLYLPVIAIPSIIHVELHPTIHPGSKTYEDFYTETWASEWGK